MESACLPVLDTAMTNRRSKTEAIGPGQWVAAARALLVAQGIEAVKVDRIARRLGVTRGGFYWHFRSRQALLDRLLAEWEETSIIPFAQLDSAKPDLESQILQLFLFWLRSKEFDSRYDSAIRLVDSAAPGRLHCRDVRGRRLSVA